MHGIDVVEELGSERYVKKFEVDGGDEVFYSLVVLVGPFWKVGICLTDLLLEVLR